MPICGPTSDHEIIKNWAKTNAVIPAEQLPSRIDGEPAKLRFVSAAQAKDRKDVLVISWGDFFAKFDQYGLAFVYDDDSSGYNETLQVEVNSPYRSRSHRLTSIEH